MLTVSAMLLLCAYLAFSRYGRIKLGKDEDEPEFSTVSWLTMLFAAGTGVGLLYWGSAEPLSHFLLARDYLETGRRQAVPGGGAYCVLDTVVRRVRRHGLLRSLAHEFGYRRSH